MIDKLSGFLLRAIGMVTLISVSIAAGVLFCAFLVPSGRPSVADWFQYPVLIAAAGLLVMIVHLNASRGLTERDKARWRSYLWWGGPLVAGWYLMKKNRSFDTLSN